MMVLGTTKDASSSNSMAIKFVKFLNNVGVACIVANTFWTPMVGSIDCPLPPSISCELKKSWTLHATNSHWKSIVASSSMSYKISSLEEELECEEVLELEEESICSKKKKKKKLKKKQTLIRTTRRNHKCEREDLGTNQTLMRNEKTNVKWEKNALGKHPILNTRAREQTSQIFERYKTKRQKHLGQPERFLSSLVFAFSP